MTPIETGFSSSGSAPLPNSSGLYFLCRNAEIVYIGKATNIAQRVDSHRGIKDFDSVLVLDLPEELLASVETYWIKRLQPKLNRKHLVQRKRLTGPFENQIGVSRVGFSVPPWLDRLIEQRIRNQDITRSQYIRSLVNHDLASK